LLAKERKKGEGGSIKGKREKLIKLRGVEAMDIHKSIINGKDLPFVAL